MDCMGVGDFGRRCDNPHIVLADVNTPSDDLRPHYYSPQFHSKLLSDL